MPRILFSIVLLFAFLATGPAFSQEKEADAPKIVKVSMETDFGIIVLELYPDKAPETVKNFLKYASMDFYNGTIFHRVIPKFMIQGGGFTDTMQYKGGGDPIKNEAANGLKNLRGTIAMARTSDPHSASSQFFINTADNHFLDYKAPTTQGFGYCVFGQVTMGMDVVSKIEKVATTNRSGHQNVPIKPVHITKVTVLP